ncbi:hypothetical protein SAMN04490244_107195 [Tranquillimonas rosea]|uniref:Integrase core domain-containing protein n=1 Tax=Tranquillimonas rosea TaxID=641238 RepID=A0A1H9VL61_9RHOB|nr:hypothetical protein [Tranquillimonas rosea]SES22271.1 hypothetical protein SAMN04490244_107195 [Tranquillimonas rosea]
MLLKAVEQRFGTCLAPAPIELLTDNGAYTAEETRIFAQHLCLRPWFTLGKEPAEQSDVREILNTLKRDSVPVTPLRRFRNRAPIDAQLVLR